MKNKSDNKIKKKFFDVENYKLLERVITNSIKIKFDDNQKNKLFNIMQNAFDSSNLDNTKIFKKSQRSSIVKNLNKIVISDFVKIMKTDQKSLRYYKRNEPGKINNFPPMPTNTMSSNFNTFNLNNVNGTYNLMRRESPLLNNFSGHIEPISKPLLHPRKNIEMIPFESNITNQPNTISQDFQQTQIPNQNTNLSFRKMEEQRDMTFQKPKPLNSHLNIEQIKDEPDQNPNEKFNQLLEQRNSIELVKTPEYSQKIQEGIRDKMSTSIDDINIDDINKKSEIENFGISDSDSGSILFNLNKSNNTIFDGLDTKLLERNEIKDEPNFISKKKSEVISDNFHNQINKNKKNINITKAKRIFHRNTREKRISHRNTTSSKINKPTFNETFESKINNIPDKNYSGVFSASKKIKHISISSTDREIGISSPTNFRFIINQSQNPKKNKETFAEELKIDGKIIYKLDKTIIHNKNIIDLKDINKLISIKCLDVIIPNKNYLLQEPYLWLCIDELGEKYNNNGIPKGAFARLKATNLSLDKNNLGFVTMGAHTLKQNNLENIIVPENLNIRLLRVDGSPFELDDKINFKEIKKNYIELDENYSDNLEIGDLLRFYKLYDKENIVYFYPNTYIHDLKTIKGGFLSFRLFLDVNDSKSENKIKKFIGKDGTKLIYANDLKQNDLIFIETNKSSFFGKILSIKNGIIKIPYPKKTKPKTIRTIGFVKRNMTGITSDNNSDINNKYGHRISKIEKNKIYLENIKNISDDEEFLIVNKKNQIILMFKINYE